jgi:hypothetical protein
MFIIVMFWLVLLLPSCSGANPEVENCVLDEGNLLAGDANAVWKVSTPERGQFWVAREGDDYIRTIQLAYLCGNHPLEHLIAKRICNGLSRLCRGRAPTQSVMNCCLRQPAPLRQITERQVTLSQKELYGSMGGGHSARSVKDCFNTASL